ncbi:MAG: hypothetical protein AAF747_06795 [Planctomycetota bacterium]
MLQHASEQPLNPAHLRQVAEARQRKRRLFRTARVAGFSGWSTGILGFAALVGGIWSLPALLLGVAMLYCAWSELRHADALRRGEPSAPSSLARNQLYLALALCAYAGVGIAIAITRPAEASLGTPTGDPQVDAMLAETAASVAAVAKGISIVVYAALIPGVLLMQGGTALYYLGARKHIRQYIESTPPWIIELDRIASPKDLDHTNQQSPTRLSQAA